ncbi:MAG: AAA family ATPase [Nitratireductor sp.]|nr:AAA family ATPase [Nitratireductor sp.]MCC0021533.1 AAA family ATPase [Nitratireductor sp.]
MFVNAKGAASQAYVIVCGNEKGGSGKTTTAMHIIVHLLNSGHKVASVDLDARQRSLTSYVDNRRKWMRRTGVELAMPEHHSLDRSFSDSVLENENSELQQFSTVLKNVERTHDFIVIDTPGHDSYLMRLAHSMADTLVTPLNDSYVDFDVLGKVDPQTGEVHEISHYARMVRDARRHRRSVDNGLLDWVVVRNRLSHLNSRNNSNMLESLRSLSMKLGCRVADGISERVIFRELFPIGLTALDDNAQDAVGMQTSLSHLAARQEVRSLISSLRLPVDDIGKRRAAARKIWMESQSTPIEQLKIFAD